MSASSTANGLGGWPRQAALLLLSLALASCGARTGLPIPDASEDAGTDAPEVDACMPRPLSVESRRADVMFVVDRSGSMARTLDFRIPAPGEPTRWDLTRTALEEALRGADATMRIGAELFPRPVPEDVVDPPPELTCGIHRPIDLPVDEGSVGALLALVDRADPRGGTPTAPAVSLGREHLLSVRDGLPQFMVLVTDGAPNCNADTGVPADRCHCSATPEHCLDPVYGPYNCLDDDRTIEALERAQAEGIPVFVVGIPDRTRPDLVDVLDRMAVAGGRPRDDGDERFYSVESPDELTEAFGTIADSISRCTYVVRPRPEPGEPLVVEIDGVPVERDPSAAEGWSLSDAGELTFHGSACRLAADPDATIEARIPCE